MTKIVLNNLKQEPLAHCVQLMGVRVTLRGGDWTILSFGAIKQFTYSTCHDKFGFPIGTFTSRTQRNFSSVQYSPKILLISQGNWSAAELANGKRLLSWGKEAPDKVLQKFAISVKKTPERGSFGLSPCPSCCSEISNWIIPLEISGPLQMQERKAFERKWTQRVFLFSLFGQIS